MSTIPSSSSKAAQRKRALTRAVQHKPIDVVEEKGEFLGAGVQVGRHQGKGHELEFVLATLAPRENAQAQATVGATAIVRRRYIECHSWRRQMQLTIHLGAVSVEARSLTAAPV